MNDIGNGKLSHIELIDWALAAGFFVLVGLLYWGIMAKSDILIGYIIPLLACAVSFGVGGAYVAEIMSAIKKNRSK